MSDFGKCVGAAVWGVDAHVVEIEAMLYGSGDTNAFRIVGLGDGAVREGRERIRGAITHAGYGFPFGVVSVNLAPADTRKEGPSLDLPIALAILLANGRLAADGLKKTVCLGELGLDGRVRPVRGALASAEAARRAGAREALVPLENVDEVASIPGLVVRGVGSLADAVGHVNGADPIEAAKPVPWAPEAEPSSLGDVRGQPSAVRAATVAAAGAHNLLLVGPPGSGKTLVARAMRGLLAPLTRDEALEVSRVHSAAGELGGGLVRRRPFRSPHHSASIAGLVGGGTVPRPGEISLAHLGVLFLDELAEFPRAALDALRQPLESGHIDVTRASGNLRFPCDFLLVAAMNPCPCGWHGYETPVHRCRCGERGAHAYRSRVSGPFLDRFDMAVPVKAVDPAAFLAPADAATTKHVDDVARARERQVARAARFGLPRAWNSRLPGNRLRELALPTREAGAVWVSAGRRLGISGRGLHRAMRVARTIADIDDADEVSRKAIEEALSYRVELTTTPTAAASSPPAARVATATSGLPRPRGGA